MTRKTFRASGLSLMAAMFLGLTPLANLVMAQSSDVALTGKVTSTREGAMEGVLVTAKREGSTIATTVVTNAQGEYRFPRERLAPGAYSIQIRAARYELSSPATATVTPQATSTSDLQLTDTQDLVHQLSNGEWLQSIPGSESRKQLFLGCVGCHTLARPFTSTYDATQMASVLQLMSTFANNAMPGNPQQVSTAAEILSRPPTQAQIDDGAYIASINMSNGPQDFALRTLPRPTGKATQVLITTYDMPRSLHMVHDVSMDSHGTLWFNDFGSQHLGKLNTKTGEVVEYEVPVLKPGFPLGFLDLERDQHGKLYLGNMGQAQVVRFDPTTEVVETFPADNFDYPDERVTMVKPQYAHKNGKLWVNLAATPDGNRAYQVDLDTWTWNRVEYPPEFPMRAVNAYDIPVDLNNNMYGLQNSLETAWLWRTNENLETAWFKIPSGDGGGRRGRVDTHNRLWWAQYYGNRVAMFDPSSDKITQWEMPTPWTSPYDAAFDDRRYVWTASMLTDLAVRLDVETGEFTQYLLPARTNVRRVNVVNSGDLSSLWIGDNHGAKILHVEPLSP